MLWLFRSAGKRNPNNTKYQFWIQDNHAEHLETNKFIDQKLEYIHENPVSSGIVDQAQLYRYSNARNYSGVNGLLQLKIIE